MLRAAISHLARRPALAALVLFLAGVTTTALPSLRYGAPEPALHDEYAYLLEAETFAKGRLTNDPPPGPPEFFDTFHELITPRYYGKFPPAQGAALAVGILLGHPIFGVWLVNGLWAIALYWMLRAVAGPGWALGGALAGMAGYGAFTDWGQSYWGGSVLALGGTLAFGGALRLWRRRGNGFSAAAWAGIGCGIMALARPLDGFIFALLPTALIVWAAWKEGWAGWKKLAAFGVPALLGVILMLGYNKATTGSPWLFAHRLYDQTRVPGLALFVWQKPAADPPDLPFYLTQYEKVFGRDQGLAEFTWGQYWHNVSKFARYQLYYLFPWWTLPLALTGLAGIFITRDKTARLALLGLLFIAIPMLSLRFYTFSHYTAAWTAPALILIVRGGRRWRAWRPGGLPCLGCVAIAALIAWPTSLLYPQMARGFPNWMFYPWVKDRLTTELTLSEHAEKTGHPQLVAVVYPEDHDPNAEWVFNSPDPLEQEVMWVRALTPARMAELPKWFPKHEEWLAFTDKDGKLLHLDMVKPSPENFLETSSPPLAK